MNTTPQTLVNVKEDLFETYKQELQLPEKTLDRATELIENAYDDGLLRSRCHKTMVAAITLLAAREQNVPRVSNDFAEVTMKNETPLDAKKVSKESRKLKREMEIVITPTDAKSYLDYYSDMLGVSDETRETAKKLLEVADEVGIAKGPAPTSISAGALDAARRLTGEDIIQSEISDVSHVSIAQFRRYCHQLQEQPVE